MMRFLPTEDLIALSGACRHFRKQVENYLSAATTDKKIAQAYNAKVRHRLFAARTDKLNDDIEDELDNLSSSPIKEIIFPVIGAATCITLGLMSNHLPIIRNTLLAIGAVLIVAAVILSIRYAIINHRIDHAYHQIDQLNDIEAGRRPRHR
jgi:hypothetical protein